MADKNLGNIEFILKIDEDDLPTIRFYERLKSQLPCKALISPRGEGYAEMHTWINALCKLATGDWLYLWNDDARMITPGWDQGLLTASITEESPWHGVKDIILLTTPTVGRPDASEFLFVRRKVVEVLGHYSLSPHTDNWIYGVLCCVHSSFRIDNIQVKHMSGEHEDDSIRKDVLEVYRKTGLHLNTTEMMRARLEDAGKLVDYIEQHRAI